MLTKQIVEIALRLGLIAAGLAILDEEFDLVVTVITTYGFAGFMAFPFLMWYLVRLVRHLTEHVFSIWEKVKELTASLGGMFSRLKEKLATKPWLRKLRVKWPDDLL